MSRRTEPDPTPRVRLLVALIAVVARSCGRVRNLVSRRARRASVDASATARGATGRRFPARTSLSTSWYCAEGTSTPDGRADETVLIASVADTASEATVTVMPGGEAAPVSRTVRLDPREEKRVRVADVLATRSRGSSSRSSAAGRWWRTSWRHNGDVATEPCARGAASDWYFADGHHVKGAQQYLVLFDPFGDDAIVDISLVTDDGVQEPDALQAISVPRRSARHDPGERPRAPAAIGRGPRPRPNRTRRRRADADLRRHRVRRRGRPPGHRGVAGRAVAAHEWYFPYGTTDDGAIGEIAIANFGATSTTVEVNVDPRRRPVARPAAVRRPGPLGHDRRRRLARPARQRYAVTVIARDAEGDRVPSWPRCSRPGRRRRRDRVSPARARVRPSPPSVG